MGFGIHVEFLRKMETNLCDINHLDSNVLLPPRKRLLACLKKQNLDGNFNNSSTFHDTVFEARANSLMNFRMGNPNLSLEEAVESSRRAATSAHELAVRARAVAVEKSEIAARAMAAAKRALDLAASISEDEENKERYLKKNRIQTLYNKKRAIDKSRTDEELARNLHRAMNSSPRISTRSPGPSTRNKRLKFNGNGFVDESPWKFDKMEVVENGDVARSSHVDENKLESLADADRTCREKGKTKQKKLLLSICSFRGRLNPEEEMKFGSSPRSE